jgi:hypothetical protein
VSDASLRCDYGCRGLTDDDFEALTEIEPTSAHPRTWGDEYLRTKVETERQEAGMRDSDHHAFWFAQAEQARRENHFTEEQLHSTYGRSSTTRLRNRVDD